MKKGEKAIVLKLNRCKKIVHRRLFFRDGVSARALLCSSLFSFNSVGFKNCICVIWIYASGALGNGLAEYFQFDWFGTCKLIGSLVDN